MKRYYIQVPREHQFYFSVEAENGKEARFEAHKRIVLDALRDLIPLDITEVGEVYRCEMCASYFFQDDLVDLDGKRACKLCADMKRDGVPDFW